MKNYYPISDIGKHLARSGENIGDYVMCFAGTDKNRYPDLYEAYATILLNELENIQHLTLNLTQLISEAIDSDDREDGSAFFAGELDDHLGSKTNGDDVAIDYVDPDDEEEGE